MIPATIAFMDALPKTSSGKVDRRGLPAPAPAGREERQDVPNEVRGDAWSDDLSRRIALVIAGELNAKAVKPQDNFIELGGDSLQALHAALGIEKTFGVTIDPMELLEGETLAAPVAKVAAMVRAAGAG